MDQDKSYFNREIGDYSLLIEQYQMVDETSDKFSDLAEIITLTDEKTKYKDIKDLCNQFISSDKEKVKKETIKEIYNKIKDTEELVDLVKFLFVICYDKENKLSSKIIDILSSKEEKQEKIDDDDDEYPILFNDSNNATDNEYSDCNNNELDNK